MRKISLSYHHVLTADISLGALGISVKFLFISCIEVISNIKKLLKTYKYSNRYLKNEYSKGTTSYWTYSKIALSFLIISYSLNIELRITILSSAVCSLIFKYN